MRTFEFTDGGSRKFWNIEVRDKSLAVTFGKIGTNGQSQTKKFPTAAKAQAEAAMRRKGFFISIILSRC